MEGYCNKCSEFIKDLNGNEEEELKQEGSFVCSTCINKEMEEENKAVCLECNQNFIQDRDIQLCDNCVGKFDLDELWKLHDSNKIDALDFNERKSIRERFRLKSKA